MKTLFRIIFSLSTFSVVSFAQTPSCDVDGIPVSCKILKRDAVTSSEYCRNSLAKERCVVDVNYGNGRQQRLWGSQCVTWARDCRNGGSFALWPRCADVEEL